MIFFTSLFYTIEYILNEVSKNLFFYKIFTLFQRCFGIVSELYRVTFCIERIVDVKHPNMGNSMLIKTATNAVRGFLLQYWRSFHIKTGLITRIVIDYFINSLVQLLKRELNVTLHGYKLRITEEKI